MGLFDPVNFSLPGLSEKVDPENNTGFNSIPDSSVDMQPYTIPPVVWVIVFLVIGFFGIRWLMEEID
jgi:hypothetical protein